MEIVAVLVRNVGFINTKMGKRNRGLRQQVIPAYEKCIWIHSSSLGEFEQGKVLIDELRLQYPNRKLVLTFFSSSGFERKKHYEGVDSVLYLPYDTLGAMSNFVSRLNPELVVFIKYEFWFNLLDILANRRIAFVFVSSVFRADQYLFRSLYSSLLDRILKANHIFVQNTDSRDLLMNHNYTNVTVSGDTRIDRVMELRKQEFEWAALKEWVGPSNTVIAGSTWPRDERMIVDSIPHLEDWKWIIAPHEIAGEHIKDLRHNLGERAIFLSDIGMENEISRTKSILVIDQIGLLSLLYRYGSIAYIGGGHGAGIHNTLEPAVYGLPLIYGPNYGKFQEAVDFYNLDCARVIHSEEELITAINYFADPSRRKSIAVVLYEYFRKSAGASKTIMNTIKKIITEK